MNSCFLNEVRRTLEASAHSSDLSLVESAFCYWLGEARETFDGTVAAAVLAHGAARSYPTIAVLAFASAVTPSEDIARALNEGLQWLCGRPLKRSTGDAQEFVHDALALFGLSLAIEHLNDTDFREQVRAWLVTCLRMGEESYRQDVKKATFATAARSILGVTFSWSEPTDPVSDYCLRHRQGSQISRELSDSAFVAVQQGASVGLEGLSAVEALFVFERIASETTTINAERPTLEQLLLVLERVGAGLYRWPYGQGNHSIWEVNNEYDFQALLYVVLSPIFKDLKDEEWLASVGPKKPRADLAIRSLRTVIEVKYRRKERMSEFVGQISEDKGLYLQRNSPYQHIIVVLWDEAQATEEHEVLKQGIRDLELDGAIIISRPSRMVRVSSTAAQTSGKRGKGKSSELPT